MIEMGIEKKRFTNGFKYSCIKYKDNDDSYTD